MIHVLRLGHIEYSNCLPVHALLVERGAPGVELVRGVPSALNAELAAGRIDVSPSSSIEYARHADRYRLLPGVVIGSVGPVESILLESRRPLEELDGARVAVPTASATSVVLLRVLLERRLGVRPVYRWFDQAAVADPLGSGAEAALWIGDAALRRTATPGRALHDLGQEWTEWTGLPFAFALWQTCAGPERDPELVVLQRRLAESLEYFESDVEGLARRHAAAFGLSPERLARYWRGLQFRLTPAVKQGLGQFYTHAAALGEAPAAPAPRWVGEDG